MKYTLLALTLLLFAGCSKQESSEEKVGTAMSSYSEVIGANGGYIVENAALAKEGDMPVFAIANTCKLVRGTSSVLIVHSKISGTGTILALQFPAFAPETEITYQGEPGTGSFFVYGSMGTDVIEQETGLVSGTMRCLRMEDSEVNLGLNRPVKKGIGGMEIVVSAIDAGDLNIPAEKKFAAQYELPIITLDELIKINVAS